MQQDIRKENRRYQASIKCSLKRGDFCNFRLEEQMKALFTLLKKDFLKHNKVLEAGCGPGRLIYFLNKFNNQQEYYGLDYLKENVVLARKLFKEQLNIKIFKGDLYDLGKKYKKYFDIIISYKTLPWLPEYQQVMKELISAAKKKIYLTALFIDGNFSFTVKVANLDNKTLTYLNTYNQNEFKNFCLKNGATRVNFHDFKLKINLPKPQNMKSLKTYTQKLTTGQNLEITGVVVLNWKLVEVII